MIPCQRDLFDIPPEVAYFNCAYMSPLLDAAVAAGERGIRRKARPWTIGAADFFTEAEHARTLFADLIGAGADDVAITPAAGFVTPMGALLIGIGGGAICYFAVSMKPKLGWYDDALDVVGIHGVGGTCRDYVATTLHHLEALGLADATLHRILRAVEGREATT